MQRLQLVTAFAAVLVAGAARAQTPPTTNTGAQSVSPTQIPQSAAPQAAPAAAPNATPDFNITFNAGVASQYVFRGVSQTDGDVQGFGGVDATYKQFYAGTWASNVDFSPFGDRSTSAEIDLYGGVRPTYGGLSFDLGVQYYAYANQPNYLPHVDYVEVYGKVTKAIGPATVGASIYYSPSFTGATGDGVYSEGNVAYTVTKKISASGAIGHQYIENGASYTTWNVGGTYALTDHLGLDLRYYDTDEHRLGHPYGSRVVAALKATF